MVFSKDLHQISAPTWTRLFSCLKPGLCWQGHPAWHRNIFHLLFYFCPLWGKDRTNVTAEHMVALGPLSLRWDHELTLANVYFLFTPLTIFVLCWGTGMSRWRMQPNGHASCPMTESLVCHIPMDLSILQYSASMPFNDQLSKRQTREGRVK